MGVLNLIFREKVIKSYVKEFLKEEGYSGKD